MNACARCASPLLPGITYCVVCGAEEWRPRPGSLLTPAGTPPTRPSRLRPRPVRPGSVPPAPGPPGTGFGPGAGQARPPTRLGGFFLAGVVALMLVVTFAVGRSALGGSDVPADNTASTPTYTPTPRVPETSEPSPEEEETARVYEGEEVSSVAYAPDGERVAGVEQGVVRVWDSGDWSEEIGFDPEGNNAASEFVVFSPDGTLLLGPRDGAGATQALSVGDWSVVGAVPAFRQIYGAGFSDDGSALVTAGAHRSVEVWDTSDWGEGIASYVHGDTVYSVAVSRDGAYTASASRTIKLWRTADLYDRSLVISELTQQTSVTDIARFDGDGSYVHSLAFSPEEGSTILVSGDSAGVWVWDTASPEADGRLARVGGGVVDLAFSPDGTRLAVALRDGDVWVLNTESWQKHRTLPTPGGSPTSVAFSPDGERIAAGDAEGVLEWEL